MQQKKNDAGIAAELQLVFSVAGVKADHSIGGHANELVAIYAGNGEEAQGMGRLQRLLHFMLD